MTLWLQLGWGLFGLFLGSLPFSLWTTRWLTGKDPRAVGDHNPGAMNALIIGGWRAGLIAFVLDVSKGAFPVGMAYYIFGWRGLPVSLIALAPLFGSAFSPFLGFRGAKSLALSLGIWIGLTLWEVPLAMLPVLTITFLLVDNSGLSLLTTTIVLGLYLFIVKNDLSFIVVFIVQAPILLMKHRKELGGPFPLRGWVKRILRRND